jgi:hypothetical protein
VEGKRNRSATQDNCKVYRQTDHAEVVVDDGTEDVHVYYMAKKLLRSKWLSILQELKRRFDQSGMKVAALREQLIIDAASKSLIGDEMDIPALPANIDRRRLAVYSYLCCTTCVQTRQFKLSTMLPLSLNCCNEKHAASSRKLSNWHHSVCRCLQVSPAQNAHSLHYVVSKRGFV